MWDFLSKFIEPKHRLATLYQQAWHRPHNVCLILFVLVWLVPLAENAHPAKYFKWVDEKGQAHFTNSEGDVPNEFKEKTEPLDLPYKDTSRGTEKTKTGYSDNSDFKKNERGGVKRDMGVMYEVDGIDSKIASITYVENGQTQQEPNATLPWKHTFIVKEGTYVALTVRDKTSIFGFDYLATHPGTNISEKEKKRLDGLKEAIRINATIMLDYNNPDKRKKLKEGSCRGQSCSFSINGSAE